MPVSPAFRRTLRRIWRQRLWVRGMNWIVAVAAIVFGIAHGETRAWAIAHPWQVLTGGLVCFVILLFLSVYDAEAEYGKLSVVEVAVENASVMQRRESVPGRPGKVIDVLEVACPLRVCNNSGNPRRMKLIEAQLLCRRSRWSRWIQVPFPSHGRCPGALVLNNWEELKEWFDESDRPLYFGLRFALPEGVSVALMRFKVKAKFKITDQPPIELDTILPPIAPLPPSTAPSGSTAS